ncbi:MAG: hypothetical protein LJE70_06875 [Chromatiaceae bacterium]|jgi:hypothetical protein|nr:hypothetical protein [Chromatiaceae bacterium]
MKPLQPWLMALSALSRLVPRSRWIAAGTDARRGHQQPEVEILEIRLGQTQDHRGISAFGKGTPPLSLDKNECSLPIYRENGNQSWGTTER